MKVLLVSFEVGPESVVYVVVDGFFLSYRCVRLWGGVCFWGG